MTERSLTTTVDDIQHIESQSLRGVAVVKIADPPDSLVDGQEVKVAQVAAGPKPGAP